MNPIDPTPPIDHIIPFPNPEAPVGGDQPLYSACRNHLEPIRLSLRLVEEALLNDLAKLYRLKAAGQPMEIPEKVTIKEIVVRLV